MRLLACLLLLGNAGISAAYRMGYLSPLFITAISLIGAFREWDESGLVKKFNLWHSCLALGTQGLSDTSPLHVKIIISVLSIRLNRAIM